MNVKHVDRFCLLARWTGDTFIIVMDHHRLCLQVASATPSSASAFAKAPTGSRRWAFSWRPRIETRPPVWRSGRSSMCRGDVWVQNGCRDETITEFVLQREQGHYYGYVYFRQVRDKSLKRGYFQKVGLISSRHTHTHTHTFTVHISNFVLSLSGWSCFCFLMWPFQ